MTPYIEYLDHTADTFAQKDYIQLYQELRTRYDQQLMEALLSGHPSWSILQGEAAYTMMLYRNWHFSKSANQNALQFHRLANTLRFDYVETDEPFWSFDVVKETMEFADRAYSLSQNLFRNQHFFIFLIPAKHQAEDSFCRCFETSKSSACADLYLTVPHMEQAATPQSILLHELGHGVNLALTGNVDLQPEDFILVTSLIGLTQSSYDRKEFFAHCFAMSLLVEPDLQKADPFCNVPQKDKQLF